MSYIGILYKPDYGSDGLEISDEILQLYIDVSGREYNYSRNDTLMISLIKTYGREYKDSTFIAYIDSKYEDCWYIHEYDGSESVKINLDKYRLKLINEIPISEFNREKVIEIINMKLENPNIIINV